MKWQDYIVTDKEVLLGKPTFKGTRISVDHVLGLLAQGWDEQHILHNYPRLTKDHLQAAFTYLHECMQDGLLFGSTKQSA